MNNKNEYVQYASVTYSKQQIYLIKCPAWSENGLPTRWKQMCLSVLLCWIMYIMEMCLLQTGFITHHCVSYAGVNGKTLSTEQVSQLRWMFLFKMLLCSFMNLLLYVINTALMVSSLRAQSSD